MKKHTYNYPLPAITVDMVIFTISKGGRLEVLLIERRDDPCQGQWALPGGFVDVGVGHNPVGDQGESVYEAAARELREETSLDVHRDGIFLEQLYTFGEPGRDPRGRVISVAHYALMSPDVSHRVQHGDDAADAKWFDIEGINEKSLAFDHNAILQMAVERLRGKMDYDPRLAKALLPEKFTQKQFRRVHEIVKGETYDRSNFAKRFKRMVEDGRFEPCGENMELPSKGRPPKMYQFSNPS
jgi:8-oxo-dGTP diphosphatase